ncbi:MAG: VOC family protein [Gemmatimonadota bacterium]
MTVPPIPAGYHTVTPQLIVRDTDRAIAFYREAFGAEVLGRLAAADGRVVHAEIKVGDSPIMLADEYPEWDNHSPERLGGSAGRLHLYVEDVDAFASRVVAAGAEVRIPVADQFYGDRSGRLADPFGHTWVVASRREDVPFEEIQRRFEELMEGQGGG